MKRSMQDIRTEYQNGAITKPQFIEKMFQEFHQVLFEYQKNMDENSWTELNILKKEIRAYVKINDIFFSMLIDPKDFRSTPIERFNFKEYEKKEMQMIEKLLIVSQSHTILDIGANHGYFSLWAAKRFEKSLIFAFEPIKKNYEYLCSNIENNFLRGDVFPINLGLFSSVVQEQFFTYDEEAMGAACLLMSGNLEKEKNEKCHLTTLDSWMTCEGSPSQIDFIKCDVEGTELFVFQGGERTLKAHQPIIYVEMLRKWTARYDYHPNDTIRFLKEEIGYDCYVLGGIGKDLLIPFHEMTGQTIDTNFFFIPKGKIQFL